MFDFNTSEHVALMLDRMTALAEVCVTQALDDVKARAVHHAAQSGTPGARQKEAARAYNYDTTPGFGTQSFGAFHKAALDMLIDDLKRSRAAPDDLTARWRLQMSSAIYAAAGAHFADIVVHRSALGDRDPLARPRLNEQRYKQSRALQAKDLDPVVADAVCDAASGNPAKVLRAKHVLRARIRDGDDAQVQIAAVLLGQIGDPVDQRKVNRLAEQIERERWEAAGNDSAAKPATVSVQPTSAASAEVPVAAPTVTTPAAQVVTAGGENARRVTPGHAPYPLDDLDAFYGEDN